MQHEASNDEQLFKRLAEFVPLLGEFLEEAGALAEQEFFREKKYYTVAYDKAYYLQQDFIEMAAFVDAGIDTDEIRSIFAEAPTVLPLRMANKLKKAACSMLRPSARRYYFSPMQNALVRHFIQVEDITKAALKAYQRMQFLRVLKREGFVPDMPG
jgi:hypothetical protein